MKSILIAVILDIFIGDPYWFPHPVKLMGRIINIEEKMARKLTATKTGLKVAGLIIVIINICLGFLVPYFILFIAKGNTLIYTIINIYIIYSCLAARCLHSEAIKVSKALCLGLEQGRKRLSFIVGRDTTSLSKEEIIKATVETVAENTSDGVIAPLLFIIIFGSPFGIVYKFVNTMDSMLGYMNDKYIDLGYFPAKIDDVFNFIPARLTSLLMIIGSIGRFNIKEAYKVLKRDRLNHKSPNSGYPESTVAGLLEIQLGGSNYYHGELVFKPTIGDNNNPLKTTHINNTIEIMYRSGVVLLLIYILVVSFSFLC